jgi:hypothetical protein
MREDDELTTGERQALKGLASGEIAAPGAAEDHVVARLYREALLGAARPRRMPAWARVALGMAAAAAWFLAGVWTGRATGVGGSSRATPPAAAGASVTPPGPTVASAASPGEPTIVRF